jgi:hypothetical protein
VNTIKSYKTSLGVANEFALSELPYLTYRSVYQTGPIVPGTPICFALAPNRKLLLGPKPSDEYTVNGQYWKAPQVLAADGDIPEMPEEFHMLIVWMALERYGLFESAGECIATGQKYAKRIMNRLELNQLPDIDMAPPLA